MTGSKRGSISVHGCSKFEECPNASPHTDFLIGRTEWSIMMYDSRNVNGQGANKKWNITFYDYTPSMGATEVGPDYGKTRLYHKRWLVLLTMSKITIQTPSVQIWQIRER